MSDQRQRLLDVAQAEGRLTSVVGAVFDRYGAVWAGGAGDAPGLDGQYRIGSITKTMTAVLVLQARDAGLLHLDDRLGDHLGDVGYGEVTLRDALAHTSGMQSEPRGPWWERTRGTDFLTLAAANDGGGRVAGAGEWFHYSNLAYGLLGEVVTRRVGAPWRVLVAERLLRPLEMRATSYLPRPGAQPGWSVDHFTGIRVHEPLTDTGAMAPAGQLWSTLADLVTWGQLLGGARPDVLAEASLAEMQQPVTADYGLGLMLGLHPGGRLVGHNGSMPGFMAALHVDPDSGIGAVVLTNATTGIDPRELAVSLIEETPTPTTPDRRSGVPRAPCRARRRACRGCGSGATRRTTCAGTTTASSCGRWRGATSSPTASRSSTALSSASRATTAASGSTSYAVRTAPSATSSARPSSTPGCPTTPRWRSPAATRDGDPGG